MESQSWTGFSDWTTIRIRNKQKQWETFLKIKHPFSFCQNLSRCMGFPGGSDRKESVCKAGDWGLIPRLGRSPGEGNSYPLQYSCLENAMNRRAWQAIVHGVAKSQTCLSDFHSLTHIQTHNLAQTLMFTWMTIITSMRVCTELLSLHSSAAGTAWDPVSWRAGYIHHSQWAKWQTPNYCLTFAWPTVSPIWRTISYLKYFRDLQLRFCCNNKSQSNNLSWAHILHALSLCLFPGGYSWPSIPIAKSQDPPGKEEPDRIERDISGLQCNLSLCITSLLWCWVSNLPAELRQEAHPSHSVISEIQK